MTCGLLGCDGRRENGAYGLQRFGGDDWVEVPHGSNGSQERGEGVHCGAVALRGAAVRYCRISPGRLEWKSALGGERARPARAAAGARHGHAGKRACGASSGVAAAGGLPHATQVRGNTLRGHPQVHCK